MSETPKGPVSSLSPTLMPATDGPDHSSPRTDIAATLHLKADRGTAVLAPPDGCLASAPPGYTILGELGRGGMGVVHRAVQVELNRPCALKMILAGSHAGGEDLARFHREAEAIARLQHPHIVQVFEIGRHEGKPFFSLELCTGGSLDRKLSGTPLQPDEAAVLVRKLALGMQTAHEAQVIHRDLKPANVLLTADGEPKVTDFGLARKLDEVGQTQTGAVMGTPSYMAPEQAEGRKDLGPATDVYSLGAILYECLTGRPPFKAATVPDTIVQVVTQEPVAVTQLNVKVPRDLETIALKCLQKKPTQRYASARELADDLERFLNGEAIRARPVGMMERAVKWVRRNRAVASLLTVTALLLIGGIAVSSYFAWDAGEQAKEAKKQQKEAEKQTGIAEEKERDARQAADKAAKASEFLAGIFEIADPNGRRGTMTARQILDDAERRIPLQFADQPDLRDELLTRIEGVYARMTETAPLAMILESRGEVRLHPNRRPVAQTLLYTGDRLSLGDDGKVLLVVLNDLHQERLRPGTEVTIGRKGCKPTGVVERSDEIMMTFVPMKKATFFMGWGAEKRQEDLLPTYATAVLQNQPLIAAACVHAVHCPRSGKSTKVVEDYEIAVHDVTQGQWQAIMGENPSHFSRFGGGRHAVKNISDEELKLFPMESVSWEDVNRFLEKLNDKTRNRGYRYRLPTEVEWEYACRGGETRERECSYHFYFAEPTNKLSSEEANFIGSAPFGNARKGPYLERPTRVGAYPSNRLGLCDMHGNVWQWCADHYEVGDTDRVYRGGSWIDRGYECRAANRNRLSPRLRLDYLGFRLVRVPVRAQEK